MKTHANKGSDETKDPSATMSDVTEALRRNYEDSLRTGLKLQEEAGRWWSAVFNPAVSAQQWQEQFNKVTRTATNLLPLAQKPLTDVIDLTEKNSRTTTELMKKAVGALQSASPGECQANWAEFWTSSLGAMSSNTEALSQIGTKAIDSWAHFVRENSKSV